MKKKRDLFYFELISEANKVESRLYISGCARNYQDILVSNKMRTLIVMSLFLN